MQDFIFDCERMKYPDTGLFHYCLNLGRYLEKNIRLQDEALWFYTPRSQQHWSYSPHNHITQHPLHKYRMPGLKAGTVWHATYQNTNYMPLRDLRIRVVLSIHDLNFMYDEKKTAAKKQQYLRHLQQLINRADALVCISAYSEKDVRRYCDTGGKPLTVIHNGSNLLDTPGLHVHSYRPRKPFLFSIGVLHRKKNYHVLLPLLKQQSMELLIAGRHEDEAYISFIREESRRLGVQDNLRLLGRISEPEKAWYLNHCQAFAFPSVSEGFGLPVVEAMSCGKPLFLSDRTALPEIGGDAAFYFRNFSPEHMQTVFNAGMAQYHDEQLSNKIRERSVRFNWHKAAKEYLAVYRSLC